MKIAGLDISLTSPGIVIFELNDNLEIVKSEWFAFTKVIKEYKLYPNNIFLYNHIKGSYLNRSIFIRNAIWSKIFDCEYVALENYSFGSKGKSFHIGEFTGLIKMLAYENDKKIRLYDIQEIKIYGTKHGDGDKVRMEDEFEKREDKIDLSKLPPSRPKHESIKGDVIDAFFVAKLLHTELLIRKGKTLIYNYGEHVIRVFNRTTKSEKENLLVRDFIHKGE